MCYIFEPVVWELVDACWAEQPQERPTASEIVKRLYTRTQTHLSLEHSTPRANNILAHTPLDELFGMLQKHLMYPEINQSKAHIPRPLAMYPPSDERLEQASYSDSSEATDDMAIDNRPIMTNVFAAVVEGGSF